MERARKKLSAVAMWKKVLAVFLSLLLFGMSFPTTSLQGLSRAYGEGQDTLIVTDDKSVDSSGDESPEPNKGGDNEKDVAAPVADQDDKADDKSDAKADAKADDKADKKADAADEKVAAEETKVNDATSDLSAEIMEYAHSVYDNSSAVYIRVESGPTQIDEETGKPVTVESIKAGDIVKYSFTYGFRAPATWTKGYDTAMPLFETYDNSVLKLALPKELVPVVSTGAESGLKFTEVSKSKDGSIVYYECKLSPTIAAAASAETVEVNIFAAGNGSDNAVYTITDKQLEKALSIETEFTIENLKDPAKPIKLDKLSSSANTNLKGFSTYTEDQWGVKKAATGISIDTKNHNVQVKYEIQVGFKNEDGTIKTAVTEYSGAEKGLGRDGVDINLTDLLTAKVDRDTSSEIIPQLSGKISVQKENMDGSLTTAVEFNHGDIISLDDTLKMNEVMVDADGDNQLNDPAPFYTKYIVTANYTLTDAMIPTLDQNPKDFYSRNDVAMDAVLAGDVPDAQKNQHDESWAEQNKPITPGNAIELKIAKKLETKDGIKDYTADYVTKYGAVSYTIKTTSSKAFEVYKYDGTRYTPISATAQTEYTLNADESYYILPEVEYELVEVQTAEQASKTPFSQVKKYSADQTASTTNEVIVTPTGAWDPVFYNTEASGQVTISKIVDGSDADGKDGLPVAGAKFKLVAADGTEILPSGDYAGGTNIYGHLVFSDVPFGTYTVEEFYAPFGYVEKTIDPTTITVAKGDDTWEVNVKATNTSYRSRITLTKWIESYANQDKGKFVEAGSDFTGTFKLYQREYTIVEGKPSSEWTLKTDWTQLTQDLNGKNISELRVESDSGSLNAPLSVAAVRVDGKTAYSYKFVEAIPAGLYGDTDSEEYFLLNDDGTAKLEVTNVDMFNSRKADIVVKKDFWDANGSSMVENTTQTTTLDLYTYNSTANTMTKVSEKSGGTATWQDMELYTYTADGTRGDKIQYYVTETQVDGYVLDSVDAGTPVEIGGVKYYPIDAEPALVNGKLTVSKNLHNMQQVVPVVVKKQNKYTKQFVEGAKFTVYKKGTTTVVTDKKSGQPLSDISIDSANGTTIYLDPNTEYEVKETVNNTGLKNTENPAAFKTNSATGYNGRGSVTVQEQTIKNFPDPTITINKKDQDGKADAALNSAVFAVFVENPSGTGYVPYPDEATQMTFTGNTAGGTLEAGKYFIGEITVPDGYLDPSLSATVPAIATAYGITADTPKTIYNGKTLYLTEINVQNAADSATANTWTSQAIKNVKNSATIKVNKKIDDAYDPAVAGFSMKVSDGANEQSKATTNESKNNVEFSNLPVYDAAGNLISYNVSENTITGDLANSYYFDSICDGNTYDADKKYDGGSASVTLALGATKELTVNNRTYIELQATKTSFHTWEYKTTGMDYRMKDVVVGLFELEGDTWKKVGEGTTNADGIVRISKKDDDTKLTRDKSYALVELATPSKYMYPGEIGQNNLVLAGDIESIPAANLGKYNVLTKNATDLVPSGKDNTLYDLSTMYNHDHWTQFDITKYEGYDTAKQALYDGAVFQVWKAEVPVASSGATTVTFDAEAPGSTSAAGNVKWTLISQPVSGTAFDEKTMDPLEGEAYSNVDQEYTTAVVYMVMEKSSGPRGATIDKKYQYHFFYSEETQETDWNFVLQNADDCVKNVSEYYVDKRTDVMFNNEVDGTDPGTILLSDLRLAKWRDSIDKATGLYTNDYTPLPNADFEIAVYDNAGTAHVVETLTVGMDTTGAGNEIAAARSSLFKLDVAEYATSGLSQFTSYVDVYDSEGNIQAKTFAVAPQILATTDAHTIYGVKATVKEVKAPTGFNYTDKPAEMWLCFVKANEGTSNPNDITNDAYYVIETDKTIPLSTNQVGMAAYVTQNDEPIYTGEADTQYRIVNYPIDTAIVNVTKYGYKPVISTDDTKNTIGKTSAQLDAMNIAHKGLGGVSLVLKKWDGQKYTDWNYSKNDYAETETAATFVTNGDGNFTFTRGLLQGKYCIVEKSLGSANSEYENSYWDEAHARVFEVNSADEFTVTMYNPEKVNLTVTKQDANSGNANDVTFTLDPKSPTTGDSINGAKADNSNVSTFNSIPTGTYKLSENQSGTYSRNYLAKYVASLPDTDPQKAMQKAMLQALIGDNGTHIGYNYGRGGDGSDTVITSVDYNNTDINITLKDPKKQNLQLKKTDSDTTAAVKGATFEVRYTPFNAWTPTAVEQEMSKWSTVGNQGTYTTNDSGLISFSNAEPGIYSFKETAAPAGYDIIVGRENAQTEAHAVTYYVVVSGGLDTSEINWGKLGKDVYLLKSDGSFDTTATKTVINVTDQSATAELNVQNRPQKTAKVTKTVDFGQIGGKELAWSFQFDLYAADKTTKVGIATLSNEDEADEEGEYKVNFVEPGTTKAAKLSQGKDYYVVETVTSSPATDYAAATVAVNGDTPSTDTIDGKTAYKFTATNDIDSNVEVIVSNVYQRGQVKFTKESNNPALSALSGAQFVVCDSNKNEISGATVTELFEGGVGTGVYVADLPLTVKDAKGNPISPSTEVTYYLKETVAPPNHVLADDPYVEFKLSRDQNYKELVAGSVVNTFGYWVDIVKYDNTYEEISKLATKTTAAKDDATFTLYKKQKNSDLWDIYAETNIDAQGKVQWLLDPNREYAIAETSWNVNTYRDSEGIHVEGSDKASATTEITLDNESHQKVNAVYIGSTKVDLAYEAYNKPYVQVRVYKKDVGGYHADAMPKANLAIYDLDQADIPADVEDYVSKNEPTRVATTNMLDEDAQAYYFKWTGEFGIAFDPTHNYLVVESDIFAGESEKTYDTLNKDNNKVVWYVGIEKNTCTDPTQVYEFELDNVYSEAKPLIEKKITSVGTAGTVAADGKTADVESLLLSTENKEDSDFYDNKVTRVSYEIAPQIEGKNQPLSSYTVSDSGLTFTKNGEDKYGDPNYRITFLAVDGVSQDVSNMKGCEKIASDAPIKATIYWKNAKGEVVETSEIEDANTGIRMMFYNEEFAGFDISYECDAVKEATKDAEGNSQYALGVFTPPSAITVQVEIENQPDGTKDSPVAEIAKFENVATTTLEYPKWKADGSGTELVKLDKESPATVNVGPIHLPYVNITKIADTEQVDADNTVKYTITANNLVKNNESGPLYQAVLLDTLPTGVTYDNWYEAVITGVNEEGESYTKIPDLEVIPVIQSGESEIGEESETAVEFRLHDTLEVNETLTIDFLARVNPTAVVYGAALYNYVYLTSEDSAPHTLDNVNGYPYKSYDGETLTDLENKAKQAGKRAESREEKLEADLGELTEENLAWIHKDNKIVVKLGGNLTLKKTLKADQDSTYHGTGYLGTATRTNHTVATEVPGETQHGWIDYKLIAQNNQESPESQIAIGDVIPGTYDARGSEWNTVMDQVYGVTIVSGEIEDDEADTGDEGEGVEGEDPNAGADEPEAGGITSVVTGYKVYYYIGSAANAKSATVAALATAADYKNGNDWQTKGVPANWVEASSLPKDATVTAFIIALPKDVSLGKGGSIVVDYRVKTPDITDNDEFEKISFTSVHNTYMITTLGDREALNRESNIVTATITDGRVSVAGDVWIDEDWDNTQQLQNRRNYNEYDAITLLRNAMKEGFSITDKRKTAIATGSASINTEVPTATVPTPNEGESVLRFQFDNLGAAKYDPAKDPQLYAGGNVNTKALKTTDPFVYQITARIAADKAAAVNAIFALSGVGANSYVSDDPAEMWKSSYVPAGTTIEAGKAGTGYDNNFTGENNTFNTNIFYLMNSKSMDESKDIGFKMYRDLTINKVADDDSTVTIDGAKFKIYGPFEDSTLGIENDYTAGDLLTFDEDENGVYVFNEEGTGKVTEMTTKNGGQIKVSGLNFWKEYVIEESGAAAGYTLKATASVTSDKTGITPIDPVDVEGHTNKWVLGIGGTDKVQRNTNITVKDVREAKTNFDVTKELVNLKGGTYKLKKNDFTFTLAGVPDEETGVMPPLPSVTQVKNGNTKDADGKDIDDLAVFGDITYTKAGTYTYTISEEPGSIPGVKYEGVGHPITATVVVSLIDAENPASGFKADVTYTQDGKAITERVFTNNYEPEPIGLIIPVSKKFDTETANARHVEKVFTFTLDGVTKADKDLLPTNKQITITTGTAPQTYSGAFDAIKFDTAGTYNFTVTEEALPETGYTGYTNDETVTHNVKVVVEDKDGKGELTETVFVDGDEKAVTVTKNPDTGVRTGTIETTSILYTNHYKPVPTNITFKGLKAFDKGSTERPDTYPKTFDLKLTGIDGAPMPEPASADQTITDPTTGKTYKRNAAGDTISVPEGVEGLFGQIEFEVEGTYRYKIEEQELTDAHKNYQRVLYTHTYSVKVTDNDGVLQREVTYDSTTVEAFDENGVVIEPAVFVNRYNPDDAQLYIPVTKALTGNDRNPEYKKDFVFELTSVTANAPMPLSGNTVTINDANTGHFDQITWTKAGEYVYSFKERIETNAGYTYSNEVYTVTITVVDVDGKLVVGAYKVDYQEDATAEKVTVVNLLASEEELAEYDGTGLTQEEVDATIDKTVITNDYTPAPTTFKIPVQKVISGDVTPTDFKKVFEFVLTAEEGTPLPAEEECVKTITDQGTAEFDLGEGIFTKAGKYVYTVTETAYEGDENYHGYVFDQETATVTITVVDVDGKLVVKSSEVLKGDAEEPVGAYANDEQLAQYGTGLVYNDLTDEQKTAITIVFTNSYTPDSTELVIPVEKLFTDDSNARPKDFTKEFTFELAGVSADVPGFPEFEVPMPAEGTEEVTIPEGVVGEFGSIEFIHAGTYTYTVTEKEPINADTLFHGYTFDKTVYDVTVTVTDHDGVLAAAWNIKPKSEGLLDAIQNLFGSNDENAGDQWTDGKKDANQAPEPIIFTNSYAPDKTMIVLEATKLLNGKALTDGEFTFELSEDGKVIGQVKNTADGKVVFEAIEYTEVGKHVYTITEKAGSDATITYDSTTYTAEVEVVDVDGKLTATCEYSAKPVFTNTYTPPTVPPERTAKTGDGLGGMFPLAGLVAVAAGAVAVLAGRRGRKEQRGAHVRH